MKKKYQPIVSFRMTEEQFETLHNQARISKLTPSSKAKSLVTQLLNSGKDVDKKSADNELFKAYFDSIEQAQTRVSVQLTKQLSKHQEQLDRILELSSITLSQQLDAIAFLAPIILETEFQVSALFQTPEESRVQSRLRTGYGIARENRNQNYRKFNEELNLIRRKYNVKN